MTGKDIFNAPFHERYSMNQRKSELSEGWWSDHFVLINCYDQWCATKVDGTCNTFCEETFVSMTSMVNLEKTRNQIREILILVRFLHFIFDFVVVVVVVVVHTYNYVTTII